MSRLTWEILVAGGLYRPVERLEVATNGESEIVIYDDTILRFIRIDKNTPVFEIVGGELNKTEVRVPKSRISRLTCCKWR